MRLLFQLNVVRAAVVLTMLLAFACCSAAAAQKAAPSLRAGAAAVDITPQQFPLNMPGGFSANMAERAHDPLHCPRAGARRRNDHARDGRGGQPRRGREKPWTKRKPSPRSVAASRRRRSSFAATHTHSAPSSNVQQGPAPAVAYRKLLVEGIAESIVRAHAALRPAAVGAAAHPLPEEVFNRRWFLKPGKMPLNPFGKMDQVKMNPGTSP